MSDTELYNPELSPKRDSRGRNRSRSRSRSPVRNRGRPSALDGDRDARKVFVSNLPWNMNWEKIKDLFKTEVGAEVFVDLLLNEKGQSKGVAYCLFRSADAAQRAIDKMDRFEIDGRKIIVRRESQKDRARLEREKVEEMQRSSLLNTPRDVGLPGQMGMGGGGGGGGGGMGGGIGGMGVGMIDQVQGIGMGSNIGGSPNLNSIVASGGLQSLLRNLGIEGPLCNRVFVSNLDFKVDEEKIKEIFTMAGKVVNVEMKMDREDKFKGFCVVEFSTELEAVQAISMFNRQVLYDRTMGVRMDRFEPKRDSGGSRLPEGLRSIGQGLDLKSLSALQSNMGGGLPSDLGSLGGGAGVLGAGGGMTTAGLSDLGLLGSGLRGVSGVGNGMSDLGMGAGGGVGLSAFDQLSSLDRAVQRGGGGISAGMGGGMGANMGGAMAAGMGGAGPGGARGKSFYVTVKNLPYSYTWKTLKEKLMIAGNVQHTDIKTDESGRSRGIGVARFATLEDARRAVALLDGTMTEGRRMAVYLD